MVHVPDEVAFKLEIEFGDDQRGLEIELTWRTRLDSGGRRHTSMSASGSVHLCAACRTRAATSICRPQSPGAGSGGVGQDRWGRLVRWA